MHKQARQKVEFCYVLLIYFLLLHNECELLHRNTEAVWKVMIVYCWGEHMSLVWKQFCLMMSSTTNLTQCDGMRIF